MASQPFTLSFTSSDEEPASAQALSCREHLLKDLPNCEIRVVRDTPLAMDFGSVLMLVLSAPSIVIAATALKEWVRQNRSASVTIHDNSGKLVISGISGKEAGRLVDTWLKHASSPN